MQPELQRWQNDDERDAVCYYCVCVCVYVLISGSNQMLLITSSQRMTSE